MVLLKPHQNKRKLITDQLLAFTGHYFCSAHLSAKQAVWLITTFRRPELTASLSRISGMHVTSGEPSCRLADEMCVCGEGGLVNCGRRCLAVIRLDSSGGVSSAHTNVGCQGDQFPPQQSTGTPLCMYCIINLPITAKYHRACDEIEQHVHAGG